METRPYLLTRRTQLFPHHSTKALIGQLDKTLHVELTRQPPPPKRPRLRRPVQSSLGLRERDVPHEQEPYGNSHLLGAVFPWKYGPH